ncbi:MAG: S8 family peptidase [Magnetococcales bacterium]|nr:S8 family peptidase [Magnetococcales bacterium]
MAERPLLILPSPGVPKERNKRKLNLSGKPGLSAQRQAERLSPQFEALHNTFLNKRASLATDVTGIVPEEVLVLETIGSIEYFLDALKKIEGLEWMGEFEKEDIPPDDDFFNTNTHNERTESTLRGRVFLLLANQRAWQELLSLWNRWLNGETMEWGYTSISALFSHLHTIRPWGIQDRLLETGVLADWKERLHQGAESVFCEVELWPRKSPFDRSSAEQRVTDLLTPLHGRILQRSLIPEIGYHALLIEIPIHAVAHIIDTIEEVQLLQCEQIQFIRASGQMMGILDFGETQPDSPVQEEPPFPNLPPIAALLDGLPLANHERLSGRLIIDDPDDFEADYQASERRHGTAMASLILWGDLGSNDAPLRHPLYVRPILKPRFNPTGGRRPESSPERVSLIDLIQQSVRDIFEKGAPTDSTRKICLINLSIGIRDRPFDRMLSPLARLLDWLAWKYKVLFLVSAGNHDHPIVLNASPGAFRNMAPSEHTRSVLTGVAADARNRRLLSPAEAMNVLTVAATHADASPPGIPPHSIDPYPAHKEMPSPINAQGMGYRRAIKPDILLNGGRICLRESFTTSAKATLDVLNLPSAPGQKTACPGPSGDATHTGYSRGTSNATALATRAGVQLYDVLESLSAESGFERIDSIPRALWLKALLVHGASGGNAFVEASRILKPSQNANKLREYMSRLFGYGHADPCRVMACNEHRVTALACGSLYQDQVQTHRFPLPPSLSGKTGHRRLIITLAWFSPVNPDHQDWRVAELFFARKQEHPEVERVEVDLNAVKRGTVQHEIFQGEKAAAFQDGDHMEVEITSKAGAGPFHGEIPYALVITLEVDPRIGIAIYDEIRSRVRAARITV